MQEPEKTLKELLENQWTLKNPLGTRDIAFRIEEPENPAERFKSQPVSIEVCGLANATRQKSDARTIFNEIISIHVWQHVNAADKNRSIAERQQLIDHIRTIIKTARKTATDIKYMRFAGDRKISGFNQEPPFLHTVIDIICLYWA